MQIAQFESNIPQMGSEKRTGLWIWIRAQGLIVEKEKRLIEVACASGHKRTWQEFRGWMCILSEVIWRPLLPFSSAMMTTGHVLCSVFQAPVLDSRLQEAKESNIVQRKKESLKEKTEYLKLVSFPCQCFSPFARKIRQTNGDTLWPSLCPAVFSAEWGGGGCKCDANICTFNSSPAEAQRSLHCC